MSKMLNHLVDIVDCPFLFTDSVTFHGMMTRDSRLGPNGLVMPITILSHAIRDTVVSCFVRFSPVLWAYIYVEGDRTAMYFFNGKAVGVTEANAQGFKDNSVLKTLRAIRTHCGDVFLMSPDHKSWGKVAETKRAGVFPKEEVQTET